MIYRWGKKVDPTLKWHFRKYIWVTWKDNNSPRYDGKTHKVPQDTLVDPPGKLDVGTAVTVHWNSTKKNFLEGGGCSVKGSCTKD